MVMKKFGMLSALESNYNILNIGNFVSYEQNNKIYLAKVLNIKNSKFTISNNVDKELEIPLQRLYKLPNPKNKDLSVKELYEIAIQKQETKTEPNSSCQSTHLLQTQAKSLSALLNILANLL